MGDGPGSGSLLRLDPRRRPARPELYATGLRNPWRFSFDRATGALLIGDVGDEDAEEVDVLAPGAPAGADFGWPAFEGDLRRGPGDPPALRRAGARARGTPTAGARSPAATWSATARLPALAGRYVYADLCSGRMWSAALAGATLRDARPLGLTAAYPVSFGEDARGRVYVVSFGGEVSRLRALASGTSHRTPIGGSVISAENACWCHGIGSASMPPRLPVSVPP